MSTVNQVCASIIEKVTNSRLDFNINQTPYSIHFSLRKKFSKNSNKIPLDCGSSSTMSQLENQDDSLRQELLNTRKEYEKLYSYYLIEKDSKSELEAKYCKVLENVTNVEKIESNTKAQKVENKNLKEKYENKCLEVKQLKTDIENIKREKNALSVALQSAKVNTKEQSKIFDKKQLEFEKKIVELSEFRKMKLAEDKLKKRKELKKAKQKLKNEPKEKSPGADKAKTEIELETSERQLFASIGQDNLNEIEAVETSVIGDAFWWGNKDQDINFNIRAKEQSDEKKEVMSNNEKEAFFNKILEKFRKTQDDLNKGLREHVAGD